MARNPQDIPEEEKNYIPPKETGPKEIFPLVDLRTSGTGKDGPKDFRANIQRLTEEVREPTEDELEAIEAGLEDEVVPVVVGPDDAEGEAKAPRRLKSVPKV